MHAAFVNSPRALRLRRCGSVRAVWRSFWRLSFNSTSFTALRATESDVQMVFVVVMGEIQMWRKCKRQPPFHLLPGNYG